MAFDTLFDLFALSWAQTLQFVLIEAVTVPEAGVIRSGQLQTALEVPFYALELPESREVFQPLQANDFLDWIHQQAKQTDFSGVYGTI